MSETKLKIRTVAIAVGRRKQAIATVKLINGKGEIMVNEKSALDYFPGINAQITLQKPFQICDVNKYSVIARVGGGGKNGQLEALVLGISRCLAKVKSENKTLLRNDGLLTRDPRVRQRRMVGMGGKSRRKRQSPKR